MCCLAHLALVWFACDETSRLAHIGAVRDRKTALFVGEANILLIRWILYLLLPSHSGVCVLFVFAYLMLKFDLVKAGLIGYGQKRLAQFLATGVYVYISKVRQSL